MTDTNLVERLRAAVTYVDKEGVTRNSYPGGSGSITKLILEAAAEVERLRGHVRREGRLNDHLSTQVGELTRDLAAANAAREAAEARANDGDALIDGRLRDAEARLAVAEKALREAIASLRDNRIGAAMTIIDAALIAAERDNRTPETKP